jgi:hypothetical protein
MCCGNTRRLRCATDCAMMLRFFSVRLASLNAQNTNTLVAMPRIERRKVARDIPTVVGETADTAQDVL